MSDALQKLGRAVAEAQDAVLAKRGPSALDLRFAEAPRRSRSRALIVAGWAMAVVLLGLLGVLLQRRDSTSIAFRVGNEVEPSEALRWLEAPPDKPLMVRFTDGSQVQLSARGRLRVVKLDARGAGLQLESGRLELSVRHREQTHWSVDAGPFEVRVVGTRFHVVWEPTRGELQLGLREGAVDLSGPVIGKRRVIVGELITVSMHERRADVQLPREPSPVIDRTLASTPESEPRAAPVAAPSSARAHRRAPRTPAVAPVEPVRATPDFEQLARAGRYAEALATVAGSAWQPTLERASGASLLLLADAARLTAQLAQAEQVYTQIRARFAGSREAASAAFALGRLYYDQRHQPQRAANWFSTYLREAPQGALACEAEARLMEAQQASGEGVEARNSAASYLRRCPHGPHVPLARSLVGSTEP